MIKTIGIIGMALLCACIGDDPFTLSTGGEEETTTTGGTTVEATGPSEWTTTTAEATSSMGAETTGGAGTCGRLVWLHANPPIIPGGGGVEWYRTFAIDLSDCEEAMPVDLLIASPDDANLVIVLGEQKPGCFIFGAPEAKVDVHTDYPLGQKPWGSVSAVVMVNGLAVDTVALPDAIVDDEEPAALEDRAAYRKGDEWHLAPVGTEPGCG